MIYLGEDAVGLNHMIHNIGQDATVESGNYTSVEDIDMKEVFINHSLGKAPDFLICISDLLDLPNNIPSKYYLMSCMCLRLNIILNFSNETYINNKKDFCRYGIYRTTPNVTNNFSTVQSYGYIPSILCNENHNISSEFRFCNAENAETTYLKAGITYHYIIGYFNNIQREVTPNA